MSSGATVRATALVGAIAVGCWMQGGFYPPGRLAVVALVLGAAVLTPTWGRWGGDDIRVVVLSACLVVWMIVVAVTAGGQWRDAGAPAFTVLAVMAAFLVARRVSVAESRTLGAGVLGVGVVVAAASWWGVATHDEPWANPTGIAGLWRGAAGTTYANATGALLGMLAVAALGRCARRPAPAGASVVAAVLLAGTGSTLSRGAGVAVLAGLTYLVSLAGRAALRGMVAPLVGALVILLGLIPSFPAARASNLTAAVVGAGVGVGLTWWLATRRWGWQLRGRPTRAALAAAAVLAVALVALAFEQMPALASRLTLESPRWDTWAAVLGVAVENGLTGVGPGRLSVSWRDPEGVTLGTTLAHNEWLQTMAEIGIVGLMLVLALGAAILLPVIRRSRAVVGRDAGRGLGAPDALAARAALSATAVFVVASTFDFLWHLTVVPILLGVLLGRASPIPAPVADESRNLASPDEPATSRAPEPMTELGTFDERSTR